MYIPAYLAYAVGQLALQIGPFLRQVTGDAVRCLCFGKATQLVAGGLYGLVCGFGVGFLITIFWNLAHLLFVGAAVLRGDWLQ